MLKSEEDNIKFIQKLINDYKYPKERIKFEHPVNLELIRCQRDIVIFDKDRPTVEYIIVELKRPIKDGKDLPVKVISNATGTHWCA